VASLNLCTDQLALLLARPGQLVSVTYLSHDPYENAYSSAARRIPANHGHAEEMLALDADVYLAGTYTVRPTVRMLQRLGRRVVDVPPADTLPQVRATLRQVATALGAEARGEALLRDFDRRLEAARQRAARRTRPQRAAVYWPGGNVAGTDSLPGALLAYLDIGNLAGVQGVRAWSSLPLEDLLALTPDWLVVSEPDGAASLRRRLGAHPAFAAIRAPRVAVPSAWWSCGTPALALAAERLVDGLQSGVDADAPPRAAGPRAIAR
jgi:iron complex transport system substrate-binding protein